jgi:hypothetical protein
MTGSDMMREILAGMTDLNLYRLRLVVEDRMLSQPDDVQSANLHGMIVAEEARRAGMLAA